MKPIIFAGALLACSSGPAAPVNFGSTPVASMTTVSGNVHVDVFAAPDPFVRGESSIRLVLTSVASGAAIDGVSIAMQPFMPSMTHGASTQPTFAGSGGGVYVAHDLVMIMAGTWELRTTLSGAISDSFVADVSVQ